jgi:hypothetical protein
METNDMKNPKPQWKGCIVFGIINILLVILCTKMNIVMISIAMILLIAAGIVATAQSVKEDWQQGFKLSAIGCAMGVLLNCLAGALYVFNILSSVLVLFT